MAVAKKDQERVNFAWMYGAQARKDGNDREASDYWRDYADAWLQGFDGVPVGGSASRGRSATSLMPNSTRLQCTNLALEPDLSMATRLTLRPMSEQI